MKKISFYLITLCLTFTGLCAFGSKLDSNILVKETDASPSTSITVKLNSNNAAESWIDHYYQTSFYIQFTIGGAAEYLTLEIDSDDQYPDLKGNIIDYKLFGPTPPTDIHIGSEGLENTSINIYGDFHPGEYTIYFTLRSPEEAGLIPEYNSDGVQSNENIPLNFHLTYE